jgi:imidazolonepropionase-like amidohydrolase
MLHTMQINLNSRGIHVITFLFLFMSSSALTQPTAPDGILILTEKLFDGETIRENWVIHVKDNVILYAGPASQFANSANVRQIDLSDLFVMPGMIDAHTHVLLHPYDETSWNDQVLIESGAERVARATNHVRATLQAGFTTIRDLGTEGSNYDDVGIQEAIEKGVIPGPNMIVAGRAIVATGSYGPTGFAPHVTIPKGAEEADAGTLAAVVRDQIGHRVDLVKVYADYRWGPQGQARPTFSQDELNLIVDVANLSGRSVVAHAVTAEAMTMAAMAGVRTIEHGDGATRDVYRTMKEHNVALCPTLAAAESVETYQGWIKGSSPEPKRITKKKEAFQLALQMGVTILAGGDAGVFDHGENALELELMVEYGMEPIDVLRSATSINAEYLDIEKQTGRIAVGLAADIIAIAGDATSEIGDLRNVYFVMKKGTIYRWEAH